MLRPYDAARTFARSARETAVIAGQVTNPSVEAFLRNYMTGFHSFIGRVYTVLPRG